MTLTMAQAHSSSQTKPTDSSLTAEQVCDLPISDLLARVDGELDTTEINETGFFGYVEAYTSGHFVIYLPSQAGESLRDMGIRYLVTVLLGLSTHLFPDVIQHTVIDRTLQAEGAK